MNMNLDAHATDAERAEVTRLYAEAKASGKPVNGWKVHDLLVSCYVADGEGGRPEEVHEQRQVDRSCRCGQYRSEGRLFKVDVAKELGGNKVTYHSTLRVRAGSDVDAMHQANAMLATGFCAMWATEIELA